MFALVMLHFVPSFRNKTISFTITETPPWTLIPLQIYLEVKGVTAKFGIAPLVAKQLFLLYLELLHYNRVKVLTDGSSSIDGSTGSKDSVRKGF